MMREVYLKKERPYPLPIRIWNKFGRLFPQKSYDAEELMNLAKRNTGLQDFGDTFFVEPLERLVRSINEESQLHSFGRFVTKTRLVNLLSNRLRAEDYIKRYPEALETKLYPTWWIIGLQRTGTTFLHRLLASTTNTACVYSWEALNPIPFQGDLNDKKRIGAAKKSENGLQYIAPDFFAIHPVQHLMAEEEILLLDISFMSTVPEATLNVPSYAAWLAKQDQTPAYLYMEKLMKILQHQKQPAKRWVLKSPHHMEFPETLYKVFPGTKIINTHRDPVETIASFCSMIYFSRKIFSSQVDKVEIASQWMDKTKVMLERLNSFRSVNPSCPYYDMSYKELTGDPVGKVEELFQTFGDEFTNDDATGCTRMLNLNKKDQFGAHKYQLEDFGLSKNQLEEDFSKYKNTFSNYL